MCVLCFCFVKVKFVFLSNITTFIYLRACYVFVFFFLNQKEKEKLTDKTRTREKCFVVHFSSRVTESRPVSPSRVRRAVSGAADDHLEEPRALPATRARGARPALEIPEPRGDGPTEPSGQGLIWKSVDLIVPACASQ